MKKSIEMTEEDSTIIKSFSTAAPLCYSSLLTIRVRNWG